MWGLADRVTEIKPESPCYRKDFFIPHDYSSSLHLLLLLLSPVFLSDVLRNTEPQLPPAPDDIWEYHDEYGRTSR